MRTKSLRSLVGESIAIIASILIAFSLDAWWERRGARADLAAELSNVAQELEANVRELGRRRDQHVRAQSSIATLLDLMNRESSSHSLVVQDSILIEAFVFVPTSDPSTGALDALISGARLSEMSNADLKRDLSGLRNTFEDLNDVELVARSIAYDRVLPLLSGEPALAPLLYRMWLPSAGSALPVPSGPVGIRVPLTSRAALQNYLSLRSGWLRDAQQKIESLLERIQAASEALRLELE